MNKKTTGVVAYLTWIGLWIAILAGDKEGAKFHVNQALVIWLIAPLSGVVAYFPLLGWLVSVAFSIFLFACAIIGLVGAAQGQEREIPLIGRIKILT
ncbi:MAG: hypothetical protein LBQ15_11800 [Clostridium sp.]|jgi:uncharacterized membrane protein|nr:hypothetical protein [Clostridium sp.]